MLRFKFLELFKAGEGLFSVIVLDQQTGFRYWLPVDKWADPDGYYRNAEMREKDALPTMPEGSDSLPDANSAP